MKRENVSSKETRASAMLRSILVCLVPISLLLVVSPIPAQQFKKIPRIGVLTPDPISARANQFQAFNEGLRELGYVEGKNIAIEIRSAEGKRDRLDGLATELVSLRRMSL
jgi:putative ABC transport system substrate-binding protein